jgi:hypothetical protein
VAAVRDAAAITTAGRGLLPPLLGAETGVAELEPEQTTVARGSAGGDATVDAGCCFDLFVQAAGSASSWSSQLCGMVASQSAEVRNTAVDVAAPCPPFPSACQSAVLPPAACIGSPCLRQCVHGASIGGNKW